MCLAPIEEPQGAQITKSISHTSKPANIHPAKGGWHQLAIQQKVGGTNWRSSKRWVAPISGYKCAWHRFQAFTPKAPTPPKASRTPQSTQTSTQQKVGGTNWRRINPNGWLKMCLAPIGERQRGMERWTGLGAALRGGRI
jgi:hypothetical protein